MVLEVDDRAVWVGDEHLRPVGSSGKVDSIAAGLAEMNWGGGERSRAVVGSEVVSCSEAARRGIEPWASALGTEPLGGV